MQGTGDIVRRYLNSCKLDQVLRTTMYKNPSNIETIAKELAINNPKNITTEDLILYGQILEALKVETEVMSTLPKKFIKDWANKIRMADLNPASVEYTVGMSEKEIQKEEGKIEGVEKNNEEENFNNNTLTKKRRQAISNEPELSTDIEVITGRIKKLNIEQQHQEAEINYFTEVRMEVEKRKVDKNISVESTEIEQMELEDLMSSPTSSSFASPSSSSSTSIEHSDWFPRYRTCTGNKSFKGNFPTYILPGKSKEERIKYV